MIIKTVKKDAKKTTMIFLKKRIFLSSLKTLQIKAPKAKLLRKINNYIYPRLKEVLLKKIYKIILICYSKTLRAKLKAIFSTTGAQE